VVGKRGSLDIPARSDERPEVVAHIATRTSLWNHKCAFIFLSGCRRFRWGFRRFVIMFICHSRLRLWWSNTFDIGVVACRYRIVRVVYSFCVWALSRCLLNVALAFASKVVSCLDTYPQAYSTFPSAQLPLHSTHCYPKSSLDISVPAFKVDSHIVSPTSGPSHAHRATASNPFYEPVSAAALVCVFRAFCYQIKFRNFEL
jgi:hypothetical protein